MKVYKGEAIVTLVVPVIVVETNDHKAQKTVHETIQKALEDVKNIHIDHATVLSRLENGEELPENLTNNHRILIESGYPLEEVLNYSDQDAEVEVAEISYNI